MKKLITVNDIMAAVFSAVGYGLGWNIPNALGCHWVISLIICFACGMLFEAAGSALLAKKEVQSNPKLKILIGAGLILVYIMADILSNLVAGIGLGSSFLEEMFYVVGIPVVGFLFAVIKQKIKEQAIAKKYGRGESGYLSSEEDIQYYKDLDGTNEEITGDYDKSLAAKTATGTFVGIKQKKVIRFLGIPYGTASRFKAPVPAEPSDRVFEAKYYGPSPIQPRNIHNPTGYHMQDENCLFLNVTVPEKREKDCLPVIVMLPCGDFSYGDAVNSITDGTNLVSFGGNIVYVTLNHRNGPLGFLDLSGLPGGDAYPDAPNLALLDILCALRWIRENIGAFGGDFHNITLAGARSGGLAAAVLAASGESKGLFQKAFLFSNYTGLLSTADCLRSEATAMTEILHIRTADELASVPADRIRECMEAPGFLSYGFCAGTGPVPEDIFSALENGVARDLDIVLCQASNQFGELILTEGAENMELFLDQYLQAMDRKGLLKEGLPKDTDIPSKLELVEKKMFRGYTLKYANAARKGGCKTRMFYGEITPNVELFGTNSFFILCAFLGNLSLSEELGMYLDESACEIMQKMLLNFATLSDPSLDFNDVAKMNPLHWPCFDGTDATVMCATDKGFQTGALTFIADIGK